MVYFARMLDKIRHHARGELHEDYVENLGRGFDLRCCKYLRVEYPALRERVLQGGTDEEIFAWCQQQGRSLILEDIVVWNAFISKRGWRDEAAPILEQYKAAGGFTHRPDIVTLFDYFDADEGRSP
jgi:gluconokinase